jgi:hypothetical protein
LFRCSWAQKRKLREMPKLIAETAK